jgi:hypothetical protein
LAAQAEFRQQELQLQQLEGDIRQLQNMRQAFVEPEDAAGADVAEGVPSSGDSVEGSEASGVTQVGLNVDGLLPSTSCIPPGASMASSIAAVREPSLPGVHHADLARNQVSVVPGDKFGSSNSISSKSYMHTAASDGPPSAGASSPPGCSASHGQDVLNSPPN